MLHDPLLQLSLKFGRLTHMYIPIQNLLSLQRYPSIPLQMSSALDLVVIMLKVILLVW